MKEPNAVIGSLFENLDQIELIYKETYAPFKKDKGNTGDSKEYSIQEFIAAYLTNEYRIEKGSIFSLNGAQSNNIDCVILAPNHPMLTTPKRKIILAEGVFAAVEVKPDIKNKAEFLRGLKQVKSIKRLERKTYLPDLSKLTGKTKRPDFKNRIPAILFSAKSLKPDDLYSFINKHLEKGTITIADLPDLILTLDNGLYVFSQDIKTRPLGKWFREKMPHFSDSTMMHFCETTKPETLTLFLLNLLNLPSGHIRTYDFILKDYLDGLMNFKICGYDFGKKNGI